MSKDSHGFAAMDETLRREVASRGGRAAHRKGRAHEWTREEARAAGRKGGGILLRSGHDPATLRVDDIARAMDGIAGALEEITDHPPPASTRAVDDIRRSITRAAEAMDQIKKLMSPSSD